MIIRHSLPSTRFTKIDRKVFANPKLSDGAVRLYGYLCGLRNGASFSDTYLADALFVKLRTITTRKKELTDAGMILCEQMTPRVYVIYIGHTALNAQQVKESWLNEEDKDKEKTKQTTTKE
jgi:hypothetical protein